MIDVVMVSTMSRLNLLEQSLNSLADNAVKSEEHSFTLVLDNPPAFPYQRKSTNKSGDYIIITSSTVGASRARNIGASSIPKYRRQRFVMFLDDDIYMCKDWDTTMLRLAECLPSRVMSGHAHPYNQSEPRQHFGGMPWSEPLLISTVHMMMEWSVWDDVGFFCEPGGAGGSEDYDFCQRAAKKGYGFAVSSPEVVLHTGITSSTGKPIVGQEHVIANNNKLVTLYGLEGKVQFQ